MNQDENTVFEIKLTAKQILILKLALEVQCEILEKNRRIAKIREHIDECIATNCEILMYLESTVENVDFSH